MFANKKIKKNTYEKHKSKRDKTNKVFFFFSTSVVDSTTLGTNIRWLEAPLC